MTFSNIFFALLDVVVFIGEYIICGYRTTYTNIFNVIFAQQHKESNYRSMSYFIVIALFCYAFFHHRSFSSSSGVNCISCVFKHNTLLVHIVSLVLRNRVAALISMVVRNFTHFKKDKVIL